ncbi:hypothetical protein [Empedobacter sp. UBA5637]|uniref:hypothetical protein n=1 Tax=Empedobacter sp. UBA5637 TaxID=1946442 RepID=UPI0025C3D3DB|nr:hypothetical protein [Empedobacter sp. UBA5637]
MANYSNSKCPNCSNTSFEMVEETPKGSNFKLMFVRCQSCKTVIGFTDYYNTGSLLHKLAEKLRINLDD